MFYHWLLFSSKAKGSAAEQWLAKEYGPVHTLVVGYGDVERWSIDFKTATMLDLDQQQTILGHTESTQHWFNRE